MRRRKNPAPYVFLAPYTILFALFLVFPIGYSFYLSLFVSRGGTNRFVGFRNYIKAFGDTAFWSGFGNVALYGVILIAVMMSLALLLALFLDSTIIRHKALFRLLYFLPYAIPGVIAATMWGFLYTTDFNPVLKWLAVFNDGKPVVLLQPQMLMFCLINITVWLWTGYNMTIYYANLTSISLDLYDAARIDGCGEIGIAVHIKIPMIRSSINMSIALTIIGALQLFNEPFLMMDLTAVSTTWTPNMYIYNMAFSYGNLPYSATLSIILALITIAISGLFKLITRERE